MLAYRLRSFFLNYILRLKNPFREWIVRHIVKVEEFIALNCIFICHHDTIKIFDLEVERLNLFHCDFTFKMKQSIIVATSQFGNNKLFIHEEKGIRSLICQS
jgi:hypothetical protein